MITAIERGERGASLDFCLAIAVALDVPVARIVGKKIAAIIDPEPAKAAS
jgi:DNA-binding XRE family transcriptional regulator